MKYKDITLTDDNMDEELDSICDFLGWHYGNTTIMEVLDEVDISKHHLIDDEDRLYRALDTCTDGGNVPQIDTEYIFEFKNKYVVFNTKTANEQDRWMLSYFNKSIPYKW